MHELSMYIQNTKAKTGTFKVSATKMVDPDLSNYILDSSCLCQLQFVWN